MANNTDIFRFSGSAETFPEAFWIVVPWYPITKGFPIPNYINDPILDTFWVPHFKNPLTTNQLGEMTIQIQKTTAVGKKPSPVEPLA
jgi:hypothetical protein